MSKFEGFITLLFTLNVHIEPTVPYITFPNYIPGLTGSGTHTFPRFRSDATSYFYNFE